MHLLRWRHIRWALLAIVAGFALIQLVPYGRAHTNPPVVREPPWDSPRTRQLAKLACFDCHSNETRWPWYSNVAPASWLDQRDVDEGRSTLNFSDWHGPNGNKARETADQVRSGEMPPLQYTLVQGRARLSDAEQRELARGLRATLSR